MGKKNTLNALIVCADEQEGALLWTAVIEAGYWPYVADTAEHVQERLTDETFHMVLFQCRSTEEAEGLIELAKFVHAQGAIFVLRCDQATRLCHDGHFPSGTRFIGSTPAVGRHYLSKEELPQLLRL